MSDTRTEIELVVQFQGREKTTRFVGISCPVDYDDCIVCLEDKRLSEGSYRFINLRTAEWWIIREIKEAKDETT